MPVVETKELSDSDFDALQRLWGLVCPSYYNSIQIYKNGTPTHSPERNWVANWVANHPNTNFGIVFEFNREAPEHVHKFLAKCECGETKAV